RHCGYCAEETTQVHKQRDVLCVERVILGFFCGVGGKLIAAVHLCPAGNAGADIEDTAFATLEAEVFLILGGAGARAHETHVALEHVEDLRKLVNGGLTQPLAQRRDEGIRILEHVRGKARRFRVHGAELVDLERLFILAEAFLLEDYWPLGGCLDGNGRRSHDGGGREAKCGGADDVEAALENVTVEHMLHGENTFLREPVACWDLGFSRAEILDGAGNALFEVNLRGPPENRACALERKGGTGEIAEASGFVRGSIGSAG